MMQAADNWIIYRLSERSLNKTYKPSLSTFLLMKTKVVRVNAFEPIFIFL